MAEVSDKIDPNPKVKYAFRFGSSDQLLYLTQHQIDLIPYLSIFMTHKEDFASIQNENGEYVLNHPIEYPWFVAILRSITSQNPYKLFDELSSDENIFDTLQLFDYLGLQPFPLPLLRNKYLGRSKSVNKEDLIYRVKYHQATLPEARRTAAEFVLALANNEYKLRDSNTINTVFNLINVILFNAEVFSFRFRHHTLTVAKKRCYSFFSKNQQRQLGTSHRLPQYKKINSDKFRNSFSWRGVNVPVQVTVSKLSMMVRNRVNISRSLTLHRPYIRPHDRFQRQESSAARIEILRIQILLNHLALFLIQRSFTGVLTILKERRRIEEELRRIGEYILLLGDDREIRIVELQPDRRKEEAQSARSRHFNTIPKRPNVDRFKHRHGPKAQKYR